MAADAARLGACYLERDHPLILMLRNSEAYWLAVLGCEDMAARKFSALVADVKSCPNLDPQLAFAIRNNSAMPWKSTGKWAKAARVYRELLADMEPQCEAEDMTVLTVRDNLAEVLSADRQYEEALHLYEINMEALLRIADRGDGGCCGYATRSRATPGWAGTGRRGRTCGRSWPRTAAGTSGTATSSRPAFERSY